MKKLQNQEILTQAELLARFQEIIETQGQIYTKFKPTLIRPGIPGEVIETVVASGLETRKIVGPNEYVVQALTEAREQYVITAAKFQGRYTQVDLPIPEAFGNQNYRMYQPHGQVRAIAASLIMEAGECWFVAAWGEKMRLRPEDMLAMPVGLPPELYRIAYAEFLQTYRLHK